MVKINFAEAKREQLRPLGGHRDLDRPELKAGFGERISHPLALSEPTPDLLAASKKNETLPPSTQQSLDQPKLDGTSFRRDLRWTGLKLVGDANAQVDPAPIITGKTNQVGWLWRESKANRGPNVTTEFLARYLRATAGSDILPKEAKDYVYLWVSGFVESKSINLDGNGEALRKHGLTVRDVHVSANAPLADNREVVRRAIEAAAKDGKQLVILGYSWGGLAAVDALALYPELHSHVRAVGTMNTPYAGNAVISDLLDSPAQNLVTSGFDKVLHANPRALSDQTFAARRKQIAEAAYPEQIPTVSLATKNIGWNSLFKGSSLYVRGVHGSESDGIIAVDDALLPGAATVTLRGVDHLGSAAGKGPGVAAALAADASTLALTSLVLDRARSGTGSDPQELGKSLEETPISLAPSAEETAAYQARNAAMLNAYPHFAAVFTDPDAFFTDIKERFRAQKALDPSHPYNFDFSDLGLPHLRDMQQALGEELTALADEQSGRAPKKHSRNDLEVGQAYLKELGEEIASHLSDGRITYRRLVELSRFISRAIGHFEMAKLGLRERALLPLDRVQLGFHDLNIGDERRRYFANDFSVFERRSAVPLLAEIEGEFAHDLFDKNEMHFVFLPTMKDLSPAPFMRLMMHKVYFEGVTREPIPADGFLRPGGDFENHDKRHTASIYILLKQYQKRHRLSDEQMSKLEKMSDKWSIELDKAVGALPDPELRAAIDFVAYNLHHDQGFPPLPTSYANDDAVSWRKLYSGPNVTMILYTLLKISGQPVSFSHGRQRVSQALDWLQGFWLSRLDQEQAVWALDNTKEASLP